MAIQINTSNTKVNTSTQDNELDIESLVRNKHKKEKKNLSHGAVSYQAMDYLPEQAFMQTGQIEQQKNLLSSESGGNDFSATIKTTLSVDAKPRQALEGNSSAVENTNTEKHNGAQGKPENTNSSYIDSEQSGTKSLAIPATVSDSSKPLADRVYLKGRENKNQTHLAEIPATKSNSVTQDAKEPETEQPTDLTALYKTDTGKVAESEDFNLKYRFSRWQGDNSVTLTTTSGLKEASALNMHPSNQRVMETLHTYADEWNGDKPLIVQNSDEEGQRNQSGQQQQNNEEEA